MLHISDIKKYRRCPRLYYLSKDKKSVYQPYLRHDEELTKLVVAYFGIKDYYLGKMGDDPSRVLNEINDHSWYVKARFEYKGLRIKVPFLHRNGDGFDIYFVVFAPYPKDEDIDFYRANIWVLVNNGISVKGIYIVHLNADYIRGDNLDLKELFVVHDHLYRQNKPARPLKERIGDDYDLSKIIEQIDKGDLSLFKPEKRRACKMRGVCEFYDECFKEELEDDSIEFLVSSQYKKQMQQLGINYMRDVEGEYLEGTRVQYAQIMASRNRGLFLDKLALKHWLDTFKDQKLAFIDFEWETYIIPPYRGLKAYEHVSFQYSLHVLKKDGSLTHREFIATGDCREDFIRSLLKDVPLDAKLIAYNAKGAEMIRIRELIRQFPQYTLPLNDLLERFIDMSVPFTEGMVYDIKMRGNFSVKSLLQVVSDMNYHNLAISNGMDAVYKWRLLDRNELEDEGKEVMDKLSEYCSLDSYSLYLVYKWLLDMVYPNIKENQYEN